MQALGALFQDYSRGVIHIVQKLASLFDLEERRRWWLEIVLTAVYILLERQRMFCEKRIENGLHRHKPRTDPELRSNGASLDVKKYYNKKQVLGILEKRIKMKKTTSQMQSVLSTISTAPCFPVGGNDMPHSNRVSCLNRYKLKIPVDYLDEKLELQRTFASKYLQKKMVANYNHCSICFTAPGMRLLCGIFSRV